ncbi:thioredoxin family protein [Methanoculleus sp.]|uniref:thioredoxin family protein n=1 Tax=Methanoculleus sp. TaxID=90427 RepID=UPI001BD3BADC|nr:thioredoxin family protein [Methanoculleus sp.]
MKVEVLGTGCAKCKRLTKNVETAIRDLGIEAELVKVDDITEIMDRGVMLTPALYVDGEAKVVGHVPCVEDIKQILLGEK